MRYNEYEIAAWQDSFQQRMKSEIPAHREEVHWPTAPGVSLPDTSNFIRQDTPAERDIRVNAESRWTTAGAFVAVGGLVATGVVGVEYFQQHIAHLSELQQMVPLYIEGGYLTIAGIAIGEAGVQGGAAIGRFLGEQQVAALRENEEVLYLDDVNQPVAPVAHPTGELLPIVYTRLQ